MPTLLAVTAVLLFICIAVIGFAFYAGDKAHDFDERDKYATVAALGGMAAGFFLVAVVGSGLAWWIGG